MPSCLVTGVAGFIGSHLAGRLAAEGHEVTGLDSFDDYYARPSKERNLASLRPLRNFRFIEADLMSCDLAAMLRDVAYVFHLAAQPGVWPSWSDGFARYVRNNVLATQRLLEHAREARLARLVYSSSSSIYGNVDGRAGESDRPAPLSPYGVTKLAAEGLCHAYAVGFGVPIVSLRYFTVYGPRQRPDMAFHKFIHAALTGRPISVFGTGEQSRDFTFVEDIVEANVRAMKSSLTDAVINVSSGECTTLADVLNLIEELAGVRLSREFGPSLPGEANRTAADLAAATSLLGFRPRVKIREGLARQVEWHRSLGA